MEAKQKKDEVIQAVYTHASILLSLGNAHISGLRNIGKKHYSWIAHQMDIGTTLAFLLSRSDFKSETSFGIPSPNYTCECT